MKKSILVFLLFSFAFVFSSAGETRIAPSPFVAGGAYLDANNVVQATNMSLVIGDLTVVSNTAFLDRLGLEGRYGELYIHDGSTTNSLAIADTYYIIDDWSTGAVVKATSLTASNITIQADGVYWVGQTFSFLSENNKTIESAIFINGVHQNDGEWTRTLGTAAKIGDATGFSLFALSSNDVVDIRHKCVGSTTLVAIEQAQLVVMQVSGVTEQDLAATSNALITVISNKVEAVKYADITNVFSTNKTHILLCGQSNADGAPRFYPTILPIEYRRSAGGAYTNAGVENSFLYDEAHSYDGILQTVAIDDWGFELGVGHVLAGVSNEIYISKFAASGKGLSPLSNPSFLPSEAELYDDIVAAVAGMQSAYPRAGDVDCIVWVQGEWDASFGSDDDYYADLTELCTAFESDFGADIPILIVGMNDWYLPKTYGFSVTDAQQQVADENENITFVSMTEFSHRSDSHYDEHEIWNGGLKLGNMVSGLLSDTTVTKGGLAVSGRFMSESVGTGVLTAGDIYASEINGYELDDQFGNVRPKLVPTNNLLAYFRFTGEALTDLGGAIGTNINSVSPAYTNFTANYERGECYADNYFHTASGLYLTNYNDSFTCMAWVFVPSTGDSNGVVFAFRSVPNDVNYADCKIAGSNPFRPQMKIGSASTIEGQNTITADTFTHIAWSYDKATSNALMYCNGTLCGSNSVGTNRVWSGRWYVKESPTGGNSSDIILDDVMWFDTPLDQEKIKSIYQSQSSGEEGMLWR